MSGRGSKLVALALVALVVAAGVGYWFLTPKMPNEPTSTVATISGLTPLQRTQIPTTSTTLTSAATPAASEGTTEVGMGLTVMSQAFKSGESMPRKYACGGEDVSPPISWSGRPERTESYVLIVSDLDAPMGTFTHWVIFNIPAQDSSLQEGVPSVETLSNGAIQGRNGFGKIGYAGPCPPSGAHRYVFHLYALDTLLSLEAGVTEHDVLDAMKGHVLAEAELTGIYSRG
jgi:Raf kinase inhibitor-like YbhB/YbcL family protein